MNQLKKDDFDLAEEAVRLGSEFVNFVEHIQKKYGISHGRVTTVLHYITGMNILMSGTLKLYETIHEGTLRDAKYLKEAINAQNTNQTQH